MKRLPDGFRLSALDLSNHLACPHLTALERSAAIGAIKAPDFHDPRLQALWARGGEHERSFIDHLRSQGVQVVELDADTDGAGAAHATLEALRSGVEALSQAVLQHGHWMGRADILRRVERPSALGGWSYEVWDTKLARETRAGTLLQLCLYSALLKTVQGIEPEWAYVVPPGTEFTPERFRTADFGAYFRVVQRRLDAVMSSPAASTYPIPVAHCEICRWWSQCDATWRNDDHLSLVAGLRGSHLRELESWDVLTLAALAAEPLPLQRRPSRGVRETYEKLREQARVQLQARDRREPVFELLTIEPGRGLCRMPAPSPGDLFLDLEGDPFAGAAGLEYLLGFVEIGSDAEPVYRSRWALDADSERSAFEWLVDEIEIRRRAYPGLHVYHFTAYEPTALKRLMGRYATREEEVDRFLRAGLFVDLHSIVRQAVRAGVERYSLKELEPLYGFARTVPLREASRALRAVEGELELRRGSDLDPELRKTVADYNRDDCLSLIALRRWLESLRPRTFDDGSEIPRPALKEGDPSERLDERLERIRSLAGRLLEGVAADPELRDAEQQGRWLSAHLLEWHRRENKVVFWEKLRLGELDDEARLEEPAAVAGLCFVKRDGGTALCPIDHYRFPHQEVEIREDDLFADADTPIGKLVELDSFAGTLSVKKRKDRRDFHPTSVFGFAQVPTGELERSLERLGGWIADHGIDAAGDHRAARDLLLRTPPRGAAQERSPLRRPGEGLLDAACRLVLELDGGVLPVQGPPGSGKTFTAARMIVELVRSGRRVGVTANSHQVIRNLLTKAAEAAQEAGVPCRFVHRPSQQRRAVALEAGDGVIEAIDDYGEIGEAIGGGAVAGGVAWMWTREDFAGAVDVLFVDEAGQMSLANALAIAQAARNLVLVGDPRQLEQPLRGSHPPGVEVSALEHLLDGALTVAGDRGLFLDETWRLHPEICAFTSEQFYEGRLLSRNGLERQALRAEPPFERSGLYYLPVDHEANQSRSIEEAERIAALVESWLRGGASWIDCDGERRPLTLKDVLIVAPYNAQVAAISERLPGCKAGTVDKFQGQEAPVVIYSMTTSSPEDAPRGMGFLFSRNRLNVATSRARCACVLVANPRLFEADCRTPSQMRLANALCRYRELALEVSP